MGCVRCKELSYDTWNLIILWGSLTIFEAVLVILSILSFFSLVNAVVEFKSRNDMNFNLVNTFSITQTELTPMKNSTDPFSAFSDYFETHFLNYLKTEGIWKGRCMPKVKFLPAKIRECVRSYCNKNKEESSCQSFLTSDGVNVLPMVFDDFECVVDFLISSNNPTTVPITIKSVKNSIKFTTSITEAQRLLMVYKVPLIMTFDECTIRPLIKTAEEVIKSDDSKREIAVTQAGKYLATPTLKPTGRIKNVNIVGWNQDLHGFIVKETKGSMFGQSKMFWEGDRTELEDYENCGGTGLWYWKPIDPKGGVHPTTINVDIQICEKYYGKGLCPLVEGEKYFIRSDLDGRPFLESVNSVFGMYQLHLVNEKDEIIILEDFTITMLEKMLKVQPEFKGGADCGYGLMTYEVLRDYFEIHENNGKTPVVCLGFTRIDFQYKYDKEGEDKLWDICG